ncbi:hypothetical protein P7B04_08685 [Sphingobium yanoikuyae]|uniref:hypothetical protein n=1 Tax=Sphingobium yanoikuyae TaxID=13690 RepID=UPI000AE98B9B|nr:hypothetical protein [Sphingobium yanoikuyae]MDG2512769.1 hypothetical protein [Sphingobium yanoikuyae]
MDRTGRDVALPMEMQGLWIDADDPTVELSVDGGEVACFGRIVSYDYKLVATDDDVVTVSLKVDDEEREDDFQRANVTELVITPEGEMHAYNVRFASQFIRRNK